MGLSLLLTHPNNPAAEPPLGFFLAHDPECEFQRVAPELSIVAERLVSRTHLRRAAPCRTSSAGASNWIRIEASTCQSTSVGLSKGVSVVRHPRSSSQSARSRTHPRRARLGILPFRNHHSEIDPVQEPERGLILGLSIPRRDPHRGMAGDVVVDSVGTLQITK
jgi:hypothetical protein